MLFSKFLWRRQYYNIYDFKYCVKSGQNAALQRNVWRYRFGGEKGEDQGRMRLKKGEQRSCECPIPASAEGQAGWGIEQSGLVGGIYVCGRALELDL